MKEKEWLRRFKHTLSQYYCAPEISIIIKIKRLQGVHVVTHTIGFHYSFNTMDSLILSGFWNMADLWLVSTILFFIQFFFIFCSSFSNSAPDLDFQILIFVSSALLPESFYPTHDLFATSIARYFSPLIQSQILWYLLNRPDLFPRHKVSFSRDGKPFLLSEVSTSYTSKLTRCRSFWCWY